MRLLNVLLLLAFVQVTGHSQIVISFEDAGTDLVVTASGSVDLTGATFINGSATGFSDLVISNGVYERLISLQSGDDIYRIASSGDFLSGSDVDVSASERSGDSFGLYASTSRVYFYVPDGFTSGIISGSVTYPGIQIADVNPIAQTFSWGASVAQSVTIVVVPEPSTCALLLGTVALGVVAYRRGR